MKFLNNLFRRKSGGMSSATLLEFFKLGGRAKWFGHTYWNFATEAYAKNIIAFHCIKTISESAADIPVQVMVNGKIVENHPILTLLKRPNPVQGWKTFMKNAITHRLISGNCYIWINQVSTKKVMGLQLFRPDHITIMYTANYIPYEYIYNYYGLIQHFPIEPYTQHSEILHIKEPNPLDVIYGMSPIAAASMSVDQHNESGEWNKKLLENSARPPGILTIKDKTETAPAMDKEQLAKLREDLDENLVGSRNAGKIPILNFDMQWQSLGMAPTDMDWINGKDSSARDICYAFGFPPHLLGLPDGSTYNNMSEARMALYEETVIPLLQNYLEEISYFINYHTGMNIEIVPDLDSVTALTPRREAARTTARADLAAGIVTINEARHEAGFPPIEGGDEIMVPVGRLPLNFDPGTDMSKAQYHRWLLKEGIPEVDAKRIADLAYPQN